MAELDEIPVGLFRHSHPFNSLVTMQKYGIAKYKIQSRWNGGYYSATYGKRAKYRALFIARANALCFLEETMEILHGMIFPFSEMNF
jgi:hypothetical protein